MLLILTFFFVALVDFDHDMGVEDPPREFVLKDKTWSGFADILYDIYKEMASEKGYHTG